jgi:hypothetical protein
MNQTQQLNEIIAHLPEQAIAEVIDFAEFVAHKLAKTRGNDPLENLIGSMKNSDVFAGRDPLEIQQEMRSEWVR